MLRAILLVVTGPASAFALPATEVHQHSTEGHHRHSTHLRTLGESSALVGGWIHSAPILVNLYSRDIGVIFVLSWFPKLATGF